MGIHQIVVNLKGESGKMPKICVNSPEISMEGDISLHAQVSIVTKAKLDEVKVAGNCACDGPPPPRPKTPEEEHNVEVIVKVDGKEVAKVIIKVTPTTIFVHTVDSISDLTTES